MKKIVSLLILLYLFLLFFNVREIKAQPPFCEPSNCDGTWSWPQITFMNAGPCVFQVKFETRDCDNDFFQLRILSIKPLNACSDIRTLVGYAVNILLGSFNLTFQSDADYPIVQVITPACFEYSGYTFTFESCIAGLDTVECCITQYFLVENPPNSSTYYCDYWTYYNQSPSNCEDFIGQDCIYTCQSLGVPEGENNPLPKRTPCVNSLANQRWAYTSFGSSYLAVKYRYTNAGQGNPSPFSIDEIYCTGTCDWSNGKAIMFREATKGVLKDLFSNLGISSTEHKLKSSCWWDYNFDNEKLAPAVNGYCCFQSQGNILYSTYLDQGLVKSNSLSPNQWDNLINYCGASDLEFVCKESVLRFNNEPLPRIITGEGGEEHSINVEITSSHVFPNPTSGLLNIYLLDKAKGYSEINIYDIMGREVIKAGKEKNNYETYFNFDTSTLRGGLYNYFIRINNLLVAHGLFLVIN